MTIPHHRPDFHLRPLSPQDWSFLAASRIAPPFAIQLVVEGTGTLSLAELGLAVAGTADSCPGARLSRRGQTWFDTGCMPSVRTAGNVVAQLGTMLPLDAGRGCEVLLTRTGTRSTVVFRAHRAAMDTPGLFAWAFDVFRALQGRQQIGPAAPICDVALLGALTQRSPRRVRRMRSEFHTPPTRSAIRTGVTTSWTRRSVDGSHPALVAKVAAAVADFTGGSTTVMVPVDLRSGRDNPGATVGISLPLYLEGGAGDSCEDWRRRLVTELEDRRELLAGKPPVTQEPLPAISGLAQALYSATAASRDPVSAVVRDLGRIDTEAFAAPGFEADSVQYLPPRLPFVPMSIAAVEFGGRTEIVMAHPDLLVAARSASALLDAVRETLTG